LHLPARQPRIVFGIRFKNSVLIVLNTSAGSRRVKALDPGLRSRSSCLEMLIVIGFMVFSQLVHSTCGTSTMVGLSPVEVRHGWLVSTEKAR